MPGRTTGAGSRPTESSKEFVCGDCGSTFTLPADVVARYRDWTPKQCLRCRNRKEEPNRTLAEVLDTFSDGPQTGIFTDGCCEGNPGPGGWGAVKVADGEVVEERHGHDPQTTNNRMELSALIEGYRMLAPDESLPVYSDSSLCVNTITKWAADWERNGWRRGKRREEVKNLDLVQELYDLAASRPNADLQWIKGHDGSRWNEYADSLSRAYQREEA